MLKPSPLLCNRGNGGETVQIYTVTYAPDNESTPQMTPGTLGPPIPAVVNRQDGKPLEANGTTEANYAYQVMALCKDDPGVAVEIPFVFNDFSGTPRTLVAMTAAHLRAPECWTWGADEESGV